MVGQAGSVSSPCPTSQTASRSDPSAAASGARAEHTAKPTNCCFAPGTVVYWPMETAHEAVGRVATKAPPAPRGAGHTRRAAALEGASGAGAEMVRACGGGGEGGEEEGRRKATRNGFVAARSAWTMSA